MFSRLLTVLVIIALSWLAVCVVAMLTGHIDALPWDILTQAQVAGRIGLTDEELSESLHDRRAWSTVELVQLAEVLNLDAHWLIAGRPDPYRLTITARHDVEGAPDRDG